MNGKFEERLARLAFGDITPEEARRLEQEAQGNSDAARVLMEYRAMRDGLRGLGAEVPADQLSKERLRDAILGQGLRPAPEPARTSLNWLWMPTVACALAFGIFTVRNNMPSGNGQPMIVMDQAKPTEFDTNLMPSTMVADLTALPKQEKVAPPATPVKRVMTLASNSKPVTESRRKRRKRGPIIIDAAQANNDLSGTADRVIEPEKKELVSTPLKEEKTNPDAVVTLASAPIVLIDTGKNAETGASTATEVGTANNVLVGG